MFTFNMNFNYVLYLLNMCRERSNRSDNSAKINRNEK